MKPIWSLVITLGMYALFLCGMLFLYKKYIDKMVEYKNKADIGIGGNL